MYSNRNFFVVCEFSFLVVFFFLTFSNIKYKEQQQQKIQNKGHITVSIRIVSCLVGMSLSESDEDAASGIATELETSEQNSMSRNVSTEPPLKGLCDELRKCLTYVSSVNINLARLSSSVPNVVFFEVENKRFAVHKSTLEKDPQSLLFVLANNHFSSQIDSSDDSKLLQKGKKIRIESKRTASADKEEYALSQFPHVNFGSPIKIANRNAEIFRMLLNFLRGYKNAISPEWVEACKAEAHFYGLENSWNRCFQSVSNKETSWTFAESNQKDIFRCDALCTMIGEIMERGIHLVELSCYGDNAAFGVMHRFIKEADGVGPFFSRPGIFYCTDGKIRKLSDTNNISRVLDFERNPDKTVEIKMSFDADDGIIRWDRLIGNEWYSVGIQRLTTEQKFSFCVISSPNAQVFRKT